MIDENPPDPDVKVTVSIGVAASDQARDSSAALLDAADQAAYASKFTGKNKITCWPNTVPGREGSLELPTKVTDAVHAPRVGSYTE